MLKYFIFNTLLKITYQTNIKEINIIYYNMLSSFLIVQYL